MKKLLLILAILFTPSACWAQCNGVFPNNNVCGNATGSSNTPRPVPFSVVLSGAGPINLSNGSTATTQPFGDATTDVATDAFVQGGLVRSARSLGITENGIQITATVSITSGQHSLTAVGASFVLADVGKQIIVQGAGIAGAYLTTTISAFTDSTHVNLTATAGTTITTTSEIVGYGTDDSTAIASAVTTALAGNFTIVFTDGIVFHTGTLNWGFNNLHVQFVSDNVTFIHTGTGIAHNFNGINNYPGSQGAASGVFGGPGRPMLRGNPAGGTTTGVHIDNWHFGYMKVAIHDAATGLLGTDTGIVNSSSVAGIYDIRVTNQDGPYIITPTRGIDWTAPVANTFSFIVEGAGAASNKCVYLTGAINNSWRGGTVESCVAGGFIEDSTSSRNTYINVDIEANGTAADWTENGSYPVIINSSGGGTTAGSIFGSIGATLIGGKFQSVTINDNTFWSNATNWLVASTNNGSNVTILNPTGVGAPTAVEGAASIFENKIINTANAVTLRINSKQVTDLSGTGTVLPTTVSPVFTTPSLDTPSLLVGTNITGTGASFTAGHVTTNANLTGPITSSGNATAIAAQTGTGTTFAMSAGPTFTGTVQVTSTLNAGVDGSRATIGPGGTGALTGALAINGSNAAAQGAQIIFQKNTNSGANNWFFGHVSGIENTGTSTDLEYFNQVTGGRTIRLSQADDSVAFASTVNATSGTVGAINTLGGIGVSKDIWGNGQEFLPSITTSSVAQTGTVCWTTGTGKFTVDTTVGCLTSLLSAKNITEKLAPAKALAIVDKLDPFAFRYKDGWGDSGHYEQFGLGAEEVAAVDERLVGRDPEGNLQGVRYQEMTAVLAGAIQQLKADNDNLRACNAAWKCRIFGWK